MVFFFEDRESDASSARGKNKDVDPYVGFSKKKSKSIMLMQKKKNFENRHQHNLRLNEQSE